MERGKELKSSLLVLTALSAIYWSYIFARDVPTSTRTFNSPVKVEGNRFVQDGREIVVVGINYFPAYYPPLFPNSWLDSSNYRPEVVDDELAAIEKLAFNLYGGLSGTICSSTYTLEPGHSFRLRIRTS
jgi:hypothetical protein